MGLALQAIFKEWLPAQLIRLSTFFWHLSRLQSSEHLPGHLCPQDKDLMQLFAQTTLETSSEHGKFIL